MKLQRCGGGGTTAASEQSLREKELSPLWDRSRLFSRRRYSRAGSSVDSLNRVRFRAIFAATQTEVTNKLRVLPHTIHIRRHNESDDRLLGTLPLSDHRRRVTKRRLFNVRFFRGNRKIARELRSRVVRGCLSVMSQQQRVPYDRRGIVGLFWHSWQCEPFPH